MYVLNDIFFIRGIVEMSSLEKYGIAQTSDPTETENEVGGVSPKVLGTAHGQKVLIKTGTNDDGMDCLAEYFAYRLGTAIGIAVNEVSLIDCGILLGLKRDLCSVHVWEDDFTTTSELGGELFDLEVDKVSFFDGIIYNGDRHGGNYGILNDELFCIDHGFATPWQTRVSRAYIKDYCNSDVEDLIDNFMSVTVEEFYEMVELPKDLKHNIDSDVFTNIVTRMLKIQDIIRDIREEEDEDECSDW